MTPYRVQEIKLSFVRSQRPTFQIHKSEDVAKAFADLAQCVREEFYAIFLDAANTVICVDHISTGSIGQSLAEPAEVLRTALLVGARAIIVCHNHPSGSTTPSADDRKVTASITEAAKLFDIRVFDHIIIGRQGAYYSFADAGLLPLPTEQQPATPAPVTAARPRSGHPRTHANTR